MKENKAKARKRRRERAEKNCERVFSAISHSSSYGEVITSDHCSVIGLNSLTKRDGRWLKLLISKGKFTVDAIETIRTNVSQNVLSAIDDSHDDDDDKCIYHGLCNLFLGVLHGMLFYCLISGRLYIFELF